MTCHRIIQRVVLMLLSHRPCTHPVKIVVNTHTVIVRFTVASYPCVKTIPTSHACQRLPIDVDPGDLIFTNSLVLVSTAKSGFWIHATSCHRQ